MIFPLGLICLSSLLLCIPAAAQERFVKAYAGVEMGTIRHELSMLNTDTGVTFPMQRIGKPGVWLAYAYQTPKNNIQEWSVAFTFLKDQVFDYLDTVFSPSFETTIYAGNSFNYRLAGQFEQRYLLNKQSQQSRIYLGFLGTLSYENFRFKPEQSFYFPEYGYSAGLEAGVLFHYNILLFKFLLLDAGLTYSPFKFQYNHYTTENPSVSSNLQKTSDAAVAAFQDTRWAFRVGFGVPLRPKEKQEPDKK
ncbi:MAG: hypothetical protein SFV52_13825 [Saprospiraceae bacterium]|nr:hypothetical protein [Saprospiraceae bacterium]